MALNINEIIESIKSEVDTNKIRSYQEEIYKRYNKEIYSKCLVIMKNESIAKDLVHDIFIKIFINLKSFKGLAPFSSWANSITYNYCISYIKQEKKLRLDVLDNTEYYEEDIGEKITKEADLNLLEEALAELKQAEKMLIIMKYYDNLSIKAMANILDIEESAVKMRLMRSRHKLYRLFKQLKNEI